MVTKFFLAQALALAFVGGSVLAQDIDLGNLGSRGFVIDGKDLVGRSGRTVSGAGDVNGDGLADVIVASYGGTFEGDVDSAYVVFGKATTSTVDVDMLDASGFAITGLPTTDYAGFRVSGAGDVNGDGLADVIVSSFHESPTDPTPDTGPSFVIFGKTDTVTVDVTALGSAGFRIDGVALADEVSRPVSGAGDINGDGRDDLLVGAIDPRAGVPIDEQSVSYLVYGKSDNVTVDLAALNNAGFRIVGERSTDAGQGVSGAGDVNGDGLGDLIIGAPDTTVGGPFGESSAGVTYVLYGKTDTNDIDLSNIGNGGFQIDGTEQFGRSGSSVSGAGDVNGDGLADVIIGARGNTANGNDEAGASFVVFGKTDAAPVDLAMLGEDGFRLDGVAEDDKAGTSVAGAGDVNGDGLADLIVGAPGVDIDQDVTEVGASYVVYGKANSDAVNLGALGSAGFVLTSNSDFEETGVSVSGAGDVNGDGLADVIVASEDELNYVVFGQSPDRQSATYQTAVRNGDAPNRPIGVTGDGSNVSTPDARAWVDFANGNSPTGDASQLSATLIREGGPFSGAANVSWQLSTDRLGWSAAQVQFRYLDSELSASANEAELQLLFSPDGNGPFSQLPNPIVNPLDNTISAIVDELGTFYLSERDTSGDLFSDGFE